ncbi:MAG TPA: hypothetical protein VF017_18725 [Thermoanaerobaculia bacterium]|nr:hypothetical protein [Thermoanaerobaculia bacterium]
MDRRVRGFRQEVKRLGLGRVGGRYPVGLRAEAVAICRERAGLPLRQVAGELGVELASLERWLAQATGERAAAAPAFFRVELEDREAEERDAGWVLVTPRGYRVEGRDTATLLRVLSELS